VGKFKKCCKVLEMYQFSIKKQLLLRLLVGHKKWYLKESNKYNNYVTAIFAQFIKKT